MLRSELQTLTDLLSNERQRMIESELQLRNSLSKESQTAINRRSEVFVIFIFVVILVSDSHLLHSYSQLDQQTSVNIELHHSLSAAESAFESKLQQLTQCEAALQSTQHELEALRSEIRSENLEKFRDSQQVSGC
jgi:vacuolar-type H+-ATPase subunit I/STV1